MAAKYEDFNLIRNELEKMLKSFNRSLKDADDIMALIYEGGRVFGYNINSITNTIKKYPNLQNYYDELIQAIKTLEEAKKNELESAKKVLDAYKGIDSNELEDYFKIIDQINEQQQKLKDIKGKKGKNYTAARKDIKDKLTALRAEKNRKETKSASLSEIGKKMAAKTDNEIKQSYQARLDYLQQTNTLQAQIKANVGDINDYLSEQAVIEKDINKTVRQRRENFQTLKNIAKDLWGIAVNSYKAYAKYEDATFQTSKNIGLSSKQAKAYNKYMLDTMPELIKQLGMPVQEMLKFQDNFSAATGRAIMLNKEQLHTFGAITKLFGEENANGFTESLDRLGGSLTVVSEQAARTLLEANKYGLNLKKTSADFVKNIKLAEKYNFRNGVDGIRQMTVLSEKLKFNLSSISAAADKMSDIQGAITTAANLQKLGGSYAMNFSDPMRLMYESLNDFESLTQRIVDTMKGKGTFDKTSGTLKMGSLDRMFIKEYAKQINVPYEDVYQMATQQAKIQDVTKYLNKNLTKDEKESIAARSQWNGKEYTITYTNKEGKQNTVGVNKIDSELAKVIMKGYDIEDGILSNTEAIKNMMAEAKNYITNSEFFRGLGEIKENGYAQGYDNLIKPVIDPLRDYLTDFMIKISSAIVGIAAVYKIGKGLITNRMRKKFRETNSEDIFDYWEKRKQKKNGNNTPPSQPNGNGNSGAPSGRGRTPRKKSWLNRTYRKAKIGLKKMGRKIPFGKGLFGIAVAGGLMLTPSLLNAQERKEIPQMSNNSSPLNDNKAINKEELTEMEYQTKLLEQISKNTGSMPSIANNKILNLNNNDNKVTNTLDKTSEILNNAFWTTEIGRLGVGYLGKKGISIANTKAAQTVASKIPGIGTSILLASSNINGISTMLSTKEKEKELQKLYESGQISKKEYVLNKIEISKERKSGIGGMIGANLGAGIGFASGLLTGGSTSMGGAALGSWLGEMGGNAVGYLMHDKADEVAKKIRDDERAKSFNYETSKFGKQSLNNENLAIISAQASIKSADILSSIYNLLSDKFDNTTFKNKVKEEIRAEYGQNREGAIGEIKDFAKNLAVSAKNIVANGFNNVKNWWDSLDIFNNGGIVKAEKGLASIPGNSLSGDKIQVRANSKEMILTTKQQKNLFNYINNIDKKNINKPTNSIDISHFANDNRFISDVTKNIVDNASILTTKNSSDIYSNFIANENKQDNNIVKRIYETFINRQVSHKNEYSQPTYIRKDDNSTSLQTNKDINNIISNKDINLNISGTIKLEANGSTVDLKSLINDPTFRKELSTLLMSQMSKNAYGGKNNYNDSRTRQNSFYQRNNI